MERWPFSGVVGTPTRSLASVLFSARDGGAFAVRFGSRGLMLAMLCYETVCLVSSGSEFFVRRGPAA